MISLLLYIIICSQVGSFCFQEEEEDGGLTRRDATRRASPQTDSKLSSCNSALPDPHEESCSVFDFFTR